MSDVGGPVDPEFTSLTQSAGAALVTSTDAWQAAREGTLRLWRRLQPHRAAMVAADLEEGRTEALTALAADDQEALDGLRVEWQARLRRLLAARPDAAELRALLDEIAPAPEPAPRITQRAVASGRARIYQAGRDQHLAEPDAAPSAAPDSER
ncbi:hypothetical protein [Streptomyces sp. HPF1205]|uniref:hypothetical protein n=1 Tax=Streptomyces sp. HPF1205 TaxID=2873262 RepID=UPI001CEDE0F9|nr:hypothetical protein [Streptomyces sp. HPF1205]